MTATPIDAKVHAHPYGCLIYVKAHALTEGFPFTPGQSLNVTINPDQSITLTPQTSTEPET